jgi:hypothetical protein
MANPAFTPIAPAPVRDWRTIDFTTEIQRSVPGAPTSAIASALWSITLEPSSEVDDPAFASRLLGQPINDAYHTSHLIGDMVDSAVYQLTAQVTLNDGRILVKSGEIVCFSEEEPIAPPGDAGTVVFDYDRFVSAFPQFAGASTDALERFWLTAGLIFRNDWTSPESDLLTRSYLLALLTAHIATLFAGPAPGGGGFGGGGMVGRINSKSVNGVSVSAEGFPGVTGTQGWYLMTQYGALFWKATAAYRTMHYVSGPQRFPSYVGPMYGPSGYPFPYGVWGRWLS